MVVVLDLLAQLGRAPGASGLGSGLRHQVESGATISCDRSQSRSCIDALRVGQVEMQRRDRDHAGVDRGEVGAVLRMVGGIVAVDVESPPPAAVLVLDQLEPVGVDALAETRDRRALQFRRGSRRAVDVEQRPRGDRVLAEAGHHASHETRHGVEIEVAAEAEVHLPLGRLLRNGDRRQPQHDALERRRDRARVGDVVAEVGPVVDARDDQLGLEADQAERRKAHAVDRRAVGGEAAAAVVERELLHPQRAARGDAARARRAVRVGCDHGKLNARQPAPGHAAAHAVRWRECRRRL